MTPGQRDAISALIGKPYRLGAGGPDEFDCYGLARHIQALVSVDLPAVERVSDYTQTMKEHGERHHWVQVDKPQEFDLVMMANVLNRDRHIGVYIKPATAGAVIHANETMGVCIHDLQALGALGFNHIRFYRRKAA